MADGMIARIRAWRQRRRVARAVATLVEAKVGGLAAYYAALPPVGTPLLAGARADHARANTEQLEAFVAAHGAFLVTLRDEGDRYAVQAWNGGIMSREGQRALCETIMDALAAFASDAGAAPVLRAPDAAVN